MAIGARAQKERIMVAGRPLGYSAAHIALHWIIAALVIFQLVMGDLIKPAYRAFKRGAAPADADLFSANIHVYVGVSILLLAIVRLILRFRNGVPAAPAGESAFQRWAASAAHFLLYVVIFAMPISGMVAWFGGIEDAGDIHELAKPAIIIVVILHAAGALWQHFVARTDVLRRMLRPVY
jgi:cytochrome b561